MTMKRTLVAGLTALALLATPVGLSVQWSDHGPAMTTTSAVSTAHAAPSRPTPKKPPASGGPTFTSSGSTSKTTGFQTGQGRVSHEICQEYADHYDYWQSVVVDANTAGDTKLAASAAAQAEAAEDVAMGDGCAFIY